ncbi:unnamed protein product, partial [Owenia fusiformis]
MNHIDSELFVIVQRCDDMIRKPPPSNVIPTRYENHFNVSENHVETSPNQTQSKEQSPFLNLKHFKTSPRVLLNRCDLKTLKSAHVLLRRCDVECSKVSQKNNTKLRLKSPYIKLKRCIVNNRRVCVRYHNPYVLLTRCDRRLKDDKLYNVPYIKLSRCDGCHYTKKIQGPLKPKLQIYLTRCDNII